MEKLAAVHEQSRRWRWWFRVGWWTFLLPAAVACWAAALTGVRSRTAAFSLSFILAIGWIVVPFGNNQAERTEEGISTIVAPTNQDSTTPPTVVSSSSSPTSSTPELEDSASTVSAQTTTTIGVPAAVANARSIATQITFTSAEPAAFYDRDEYQPDGWPDTDGDCQNDRHEVLIEESELAVTFDATGCFVERGLWTDPYDGEQYSDASEVTIDHVVAIAHAHRNGASSWDLDTKQAFAADIEFPGSHVVAGAASNQSKSDLSPAQWRPPLRSAWCSFALDWVQVKQRWSLTYESEAESEAIAEMLATCGVDGFPRPDHSAALAVLTITTSTTSTTTTTTVVLQAGSQARILDCDERGEEVTIINDGAASLDLGRWILHDEGDKHRFVFPRGTTLSAGERITVTTGPDAATGPGFIRWKGQNVWNNDGDIAFLIDLDGRELSLRC